MSFALECNPGKTRFDPNSPTSSAIAAWCAETSDINWPQQTRLQTLQPAIIRLNERLIPAAETSNRPTVRSVFEVRRWAVPISGTESPGTAEHGPKHMVSASYHASFAKLVELNSAAPNS